MSFFFKPLESILYFNAISTSSFFVIFFKSFSEYSSDDLSEIRLSGDDLSEIRLSGDDLSEIRFSGVDLSERSSPERRISGDDLSEISLSGVDLSDILLK